MLNKQACNAPMVNTSYEEEPDKSYSPKFYDNPCFIDKYTTYTLLDIYQLIQGENLPTSDPKLDIYMVAKTYWLTKVVSHSSILPCVEVVEWLVKNVDPK